MDRTGVKSGIVMLTPGAHASLRNPIGRTG
jgi:hypothetical protein